MSNQGSLNSNSSQYYSLSSTCSYHTLNNFSSDEETVRETSNQTPSKMTAMQEITGESMSNDQRDLLRQTRMNLIRMSQRNRINRSAESESDAEESMSSATDSTITSIPSMIGRRPSGVKVMSLDESGRWKVLSRKAARGQHRHRRRRTTTYKEVKTKLVRLSLFCQLVLY